MALIKCPECGKEVSDKAKACPNCGCPIDEGKSREIENGNIEKNTNNETKKDDMEYTDNSEKKIKKGKVKIIVGVITLIVLAGVIYYFVTANSREYKEATELYNKKKFQQAVDKFVALEDFGDSKEMADKCNYELANGYFDSGEYEKAKELFESLNGYSNSKEMVESCTYELSVDGKFMKALAVGLMERWDYSDNGYKKDYNVESENDLTSSEYMDYLKKCINCELDKISIYENQKFDNEKMQKDAIKYIDLLNGCLKAVDYYSINYEKYSKLWDKAYNERMLLVRTFVNNYNLDIDEAHQVTLDEFISNAAVVDEENKLEADVKKMLNKIKCKTTDNGYGNVVYKLTLKNISDVTFEYFSLEIQLLDKKGNVIDTGYSDSISDFEPGKKVTLDAYLSMESDSIKYIASYNVKN